jgi:hypothetical protein
MGEWHVGMMEQWLKTPELFHFGKFNRAGPAE